MTAYSSFLDRTLSLIGVPSSAGGRRTGQEGAPAALRAAGLLEKLQSRGLEVEDLGELPPVSYRPDPEQPRQQNLELAVNVARQVDSQVDSAIAEGRIPLVLGGDCSISVGIVAGMLRHHRRLGLLYFDADLDLNTPETSHSGILDGMVVAHLLGQGSPELAGIGPREPLLTDEDIVFFGYDESSGWIDPPEIDLLTRSRAAKFPIERVRDAPAAVAEEALRHLESRSDVILVHFDVDVMNFPAVDVPHPGGLDGDTAFSALQVFVGSPKCAAVVVTELNAEQDPDGSYTRQLVDGLVAAFAARAERRR